MTLRPCKKKKKKKKNNPASIGLFPYSLILYLFYSPNFRIFFNVRGHIILNFTAYSNCETLLVFSSALILQLKIIILQNSVFNSHFIFKYILLIMLLQLSQLFSPSSASALHPSTLQHSPHS